MKPLIGINTHWAADTTSPAMIGVRSNYVAAVAGAGAVPLLLPMVEDPALRADLVAHHVAACDGFVFVGGPDLDPARYGEAPHPTSGPLPPVREAYDYALLDAVLRSSKPFLAICLGCQQVNVALGGTLIQDIAAEVDSPLRHSMKQSPYLNRHDVVIEPGTRLADLLDGAATISTNSAHHQAVRRPAPGLIVSARAAADGVIEALEVEDHPFGFAIQWHPEYLQAEGPHRRLFEGLVEAALATRVPA